MISTELICSKNYNLKLNPDFSEESWLNLIVHSRKFEAFYQEKTSHILDLIPVYTGVKWDKNLYIPIYLVAQLGTNCHKWLEKNQMRYQNGYKHALAKDLSILKDN